MVCSLRGKRTGCSLFCPGFNANISILDLIATKVPMEEPVIIITVLNTLELFGKYIYIYLRLESLFSTLELPPIMIIISLDFSLSVPTFLWCQCPIGIPSRYSNRATGWQQGVILRLSDVNVIIHTACTLHSGGSCLYESQSRYSSMGRCFGFPYPGPALPTHIVITLTGFTTSSALSNVFYAF